MNAPAMLHLEKAFSFVRFYTGKKGVELLYLRYAHNYTYAELAEHFDTTEYYIQKAHKIALEAFKIKLRRVELTDFLSPA